jgi:hypothetical protein
MRRGNNPKRARGGRPSNRKSPQGSRPNDSNSSEGGRSRGNAGHLFERYSTLARDAQSAGDRIACEGYLQYAEHYLRVMNTAQEGRSNGRSPGNGHDGNQQTVAGGGNGGGDSQPDADIRTPMDSDSQGQQSQSKSVADDDVPSDEGKEGPLESEIAVS